MKRDDFLLPANQIYLCGHSLGPMPKDTPQQINKTMHDWEQHAVKAWNSSGWFDLPLTLAQQIAPLLGTKSDNVIVCDSTSLNLYKALMSALQLNQTRRVILTTDDNFPTDLYVAQGIAKFNPSVSVKTVKADEIDDHFNDDVAVLMLTHVNYRDAKTFDMADITRRAHQKGILVVWDLSHSIGIIPLALDACDVDFAVGCTYKYLSGGPGSPAFLYANARHHTAENPIYGWIGHQQPFAFDAEYSACGIKKYLVGTPAILSCSALVSALAIFNAIDLNELYRITLQHSAFLIAALQQLGLPTLTLPDQSRGGHVAFYHPEGFALCKALLAQGIVGDYREPGIIRFCVNPLYLSLGDLQDCIACLQDILEHKIFLEHRFQLREGQVT